MTNQFVVVDGISPSGLYPASGERVRSNFFETSRVKRVRKASLHDLLEEIGADPARCGYRALAPQEVVQSLLENTAGLSLSEQAELLGAALAGARETAAVSGRGSAARATSSPSSGTRGSTVSSPAARSGTTRTGGTAARTGGASATGRTTAGPGSTSAGSAAARTGGSTSSTGTRSSTSSTSAGRAQPRAAHGSGQSSGQRGGGFDFSSIANIASRAVDYVNQGASAIGQFSNLIGQGGNWAQLQQQLPSFLQAPAAPGVSAAQQLAPADQGAPAIQQQSFDQISQLLQALRMGQIPALPGPAPVQMQSRPQLQMPAAMPMPASQPGQLQMPSQSGQAQGAPLAPQPQPGTAGPFDATGLLRLLIGSPQLQQALGNAAVLGTAGPRAVTLPIPAAGGPGSGNPVSIPLGAVMNAIASLAGQALTELHESCREDDPEVPEYLVNDEGEFIVDSASPEERAALVTHYFRLAGEAQRSGWFGESAAGLDESDSWARDAGFF